MEWNNLPLRYRCAEIGALGGSCLYSAYLIISGDEPRDPESCVLGGGMLGYFVGGLVTGVREWIKLERRNEEIV